MTPTNIASSKPVVMITGAAGNLGRCVAAAFHQQGASLALVDLSLEGLNAAYAEPAADRLLLPANLLDTESIAAATRAAVKTYGRIDVLCNIAGGFYWGEPVHKTQADVWSRMFDLNATTVVNTARAVMPQMIAAQSGTVINIGSAAHEHGHAHTSAYAVAKSAVMRLTESMAEELRRDGVSVLCVMPTIIDTPQNRKDMPDADTSDWIAPAAIANLLVMLSRPEAALMSGCCIPLRGRAKTAG